MIDLSNKSSVFIFSSGTFIDGVGRLRSGATGPGSVPLPAPFRLFFFLLFLLLLLFFLCRIGDSSFFFFLNDLSLTTENNKDDRPSWFGGQGSGTQRRRSSERSSSISMLLIDVLIEMADPVLPFLLLRFANFFPFFLLCLAEDEASRLVSSILSMSSACDTSSSHSS